MSFQEILDQLIQKVPESIAATFNDKDGDPIATWNVELSDEALQLLGAYRNVVKRHLQQALEGFDQGEIQQMAFATDRHWILLLGADEQCSLVLVMHREGILGRARYEMGKAIEAFNAEL